MASSRLLTKLLRVFEVDDEDDENTANPPTPAQVDGLLQFFPSR